MLAQQYLAAVGSPHAGTTHAVGGDGVARAPEPVATPNAGAVRRTLENIPAAVAFTEIATDLFARLSQSQRNGAGGYGCLVLDAPIPRAPLQMSAARR